MFTLEVGDLQPSGGLVLAGTPTGGGHDGLVVSGAVGGGVVSISDLPLDVGGGEADGLARQDDLVVGGVLDVLGAGDDLGSGAAWSKGFD